YFRTGSIPTGLEGAEPGLRSLGSLAPAGLKWHSRRMSAHVTLVMCVHDQLGLTRACLDSLRATTEPFELVIMDNASSDGTRACFERFDYPFPLDYQRYETNDSVIVQLNRGWRRARTDVVCLLHNDTEMVEPQWLAQLVTALNEP